MDRMNGFISLFTLLSKHKKFKNIPVAVLSATNQGDADIREGYSFGNRALFYET